MKSINEDKTKNIRYDLRNGNTIQEVCQKYNITFHELVHLMMPYNQPGIRPGKKSKKTRYIRKYHGSGHYYIVRGKTHYGTYKSFSDAVKIRDWLVRHGWDRSMLDLGCDWCGVVRCKQGGVKE